MAIYTSLPAELQEVDVIIAGGGSAGCIIAARLSDADPGLSILVVEGGASNQNIPSLSHPALFLSNLGPNSNYNICYKAKASADLADRELEVLAGGVLGGGSSINLMVYSRPQRSDFDAWSIPGWSADEMLMYMNKLETYHGSHSIGSHGQNGPMQVSRGRFGSRRFQDDFLTAVDATGWHEVHDLQTMDATIGAQAAMRWVDLEGRRQDTAHQYLFPRLNDGRHSNLHVLLQSRVRRVLFDAKRAVGIEYQPSQTQTLSSLKARKMVIISCGALGSPLVLERSGIGNPDILRSAGVPIVADVPGVGSHYQDHQVMCYAYKSCLKPEETMDAIWSGRLDTEGLIHHNERILSWNAVDAYCKLRPSDADITSLGPAFQNEWVKEYQGREDRPLMLITPACGFYGDRASVPKGQYYCIAPFSTYPVSRGEIHITGPGLEDVPDFSTGFLSDPENVDLKQHIWAYKIQRRIARRMEIFRGEVAHMHPEFSPGSQAACIDGPAVGSAYEISYSHEDDEVIAQWVRKNLSSTWHSQGTCRMSLVREQGGVVDADLNVYGIERLKVADLSILPGNVGCNTNSVAMAIGEKAADIIILELDLET
ncbi:GMC oxidoreductase [Xylaria bambusicola]|uniref:GMC oxidoreductase n=1 Tax=Xylaria bambusicola TaxID=326684 RepID=UPI002007D76E|nr:GMC oxidoreductase [Xylaria bambusicola]KAI0506925.1 GMC oxidoreductase [Xylaria bambusicola]